VEQDQHVVGGTREVGVGGGPGRLRGFKGVKVEN
jgi:hypothetical protein